MAEKLEVVITGNPAGALRSLRQVQDSMRDLGGTASAALGKALKVGALAAATAIGSLSAAMVGAIKSASDWAEKLDAVGDVLGTTARESAALTVAVEGVGVPVEDVTRAMARLANGLKNTEGEAGPVTDALRRLGVKFQDANGNILPTTKILEAVATKLAAMPDGLEKTNLMMDLFGRSGAELSDVMTALASGGLEAAAQKAERLGLVMSDDAVEGAIKFNRSLNDLKMALRGVAVQVGVHVLPVVEKFVNLLVTNLPNITKTVDEVSGRVFSRFESIRNTVAGVLEGIRKELDRLGIKLPPSLNTITDLVQRSILGPFSALAPLVGTAIQQVIGTIQQHSGGIQAGLERIGEAARSIGSVFVTLGEVIGPRFKELGAALASVMGESLEAIFSGESLAKLNNILNQVVDVVRGVVGPITVIISDLLGNITTFINAHKDEIVGVFQTAWNTVLDIVSGVLEILKLTIVPVLQEIMAIIRRHGDEIQAVLSAVWTIASNIVQGALDLIRGIINTVVALLKGDWEGAWQSISDTLEKFWGHIYNIIEGAVKGIAAILSAVWSEIDEEVQNTWNGISQFILGVWESIKSAVRNGVNSVIDFINGLISAYNRVAEALGLGQIGLLPHLAAGALNFPGGWAVVGEMGPELVFLPRGASVFPVASTSISNTFNLTVYGGGRTESVVNDYYLMRAWAARS